MSELRAMEQRRVLACKQLWWNGIIRTLFDAFVMTGFVVLVLVVLYIFGVPFN